jgi:tetratricopeptide (TPR) repeat protein
VIAAAVVVLLPSVAAAKWTRLNTANFQFIGDATPTQIRRVAERLEVFREVLTRALPGANTSSPVPTIVMVFQTDRSLNPVKPLFRGRTTEIGGYMQAGEDVNYIALNSDNIDFALTTILHEYAHLVVRENLGFVPPWLNEGVAEFYEVMEGLDGGGKSVIIGRAPAHHVELLKGSTLISIKELLAIDHRSPVYNEGSRRGVFYAESWALTHYLTLGNKERTPQFLQYLGALKTGADPERAFSDAFGADTATLDRELFEYIRRFAYPAIRMQFPEKVVAETERGTTMDDLDAEVYVADLQARINRVDEARERLQAIVKRKPSAARAWSALGLIEFRARRFTEALTLLERGAQEDVLDPFVQSALGRASIFVLSQQSNSDERSETLRKARGALNRAVELDPNSAYAAGTLGFIELQAGTDLPRAIALLERASQLAPNREQYRLELAQALIRQGEYRRATDYLGPLLAAGSSPAVRDEARRLLGIAGERNARMQAAAESRANSANRPGMPNATTSTTPPGLARGAMPPARSTVRLDLRVVREGETRVLGQFRGIECRQNAMALIIDVDGTLLRLAAQQLSDVDFITYRSDPAGSVTCGVLPAPVRVFATYRVRTAKTPVGPIDGDVVAIELLPDTFVLDPRSR